MDDIALKENLNQLLPQAHKQNKRKPQSLSPPL